MPFANTASRITRNCNFSRTNIIYVVTGLIGPLHDIIKKVRLSIASRLMKLLLVVEYQ